MTIVWWSFVALLLVAVVTIVSPLVHAYRGRRRHEAQLNALTSAPYESVLAEARRRAAAIGPSRAADRLIRDDVATDAVLLERLRALRIEVCSELAGVHRYVDSDVHHVLLAVKLRLSHGQQAPGQGVFR